MTEGGEAENDKADGEESSAIHDSEVFLSARTAVEQRILFRCSDAGFTPYISYELLGTVSRTLVQ
jgi:hypothetical protein